MDNCIEPCQYSHIYISADRNLVISRVSVGSSTVIDTDSSQG